MADFVNLDNEQANLLNFLNSVKDVLGDAPAQGSAIASLTDNTAGTADGTLDDVSTAVTGVNGIGSNAASKADVDTRLVAIDENFAELNTKVDAILAALRSIGLIAT